MNLFLALVASLLAPAIGQHAHNSNTAGAEGPPKNTTLFSEGTYSFMNYGVVDKVIGELRTMVYENDQKSSPIGVTELNAVQNFILGKNEKHIQQSWVQGADGVVNEKFNISKSFFESVHFWYDAAGGASVRGDP